MSITLDQARALDALARHGTFAGAASALKKRHTAVLYALRTMEEQTNLTLLDRHGYRTKLTAAGERILEHARRLLAVERDLEAACVEIQTGWEPELSLVFDGIFPVEPILTAAAAIGRAGASTRVDVTSEFLTGVERVFIERHADLMIAVLPLQFSAGPAGGSGPARASTGLKVVRLAPIRALLVAHRDHPLGRAASHTTLEPADLASHVLLSVRGSDPRLQLSTRGLEPPIAVQLNDFYAKKAGILAKMGYGWMPEHLVERELEKKTLVTLTWRDANVHVFEPRLYYRAHQSLGRAARLVVDHLKKHASS